MPAISHSAILSGIPLFDGLPEGTLSNLNALLQCKTFPARTPVIVAGQPGEAVYIVVSGTLKVYCEQQNGAEVILAILRRGEVVGEMSIVDALGRSASVATIEESALLWLDRDAFWRVLRDAPTVTFNLIRILSRRLRLANTQMQALGTLDVAGRVASWILALAREFGEPAGDGTVIPFNLSQGEIAGLVGATRVRVNQILAAYRRQNYITVDQDSRIVVRDADALAQRCR